MSSFPRLRVYRDHDADGSLCWRGEVSVYGGTCCEIVLYATRLLANERMAWSEAERWLRKHQHERGRS